MSAGCRIPEEKASPSASNDFYAGLFIAYATHLYKTVKTVKFVWKLLAFLLKLVAKFWNLIAEVLKKVSIAWT